MASKSGHIKSFNNHIEKEISNLFNNDSNFKISILNGTANHVAFDLSFPLTI